MSLATTAGVLSCLLCTRTIIITLFQEHDTFIRAISGLLAGILTVYLAAPPHLMDNRKKNRTNGGHGHQIRIDHENMTVALTSLLVYSFFDVVVNQHVIWVIFPLLGWTVSSVLYSQSFNGFVLDHPENRHDVDRHGTQQTRSKSGIIITTRKNHASNINPKASVIDERSSSRIFLVNRGGVDAAGKSSTNLANGRTIKNGPPHVTFAQSPSRRITNRYNTIIQPNPPPPELVSSTLLPLTSTNVRQITQSSKHFNDTEQEVAFSENLTFHTAESTFSFFESESSETDSQYTLARTIQSGVSGSTTTKASLGHVNQIGEELTLNEEPFNENFEEIPDELSSDGEEEEESSQEAVDNAVILFNAEAQNGTTDYKPHLIPQDYISQTYVRVEKFVSVVDGTELGEQIEVIPEPQSQSGIYGNKTELRNQKEYLENLLAYEPSVTSSSTSVLISELEGNMRAIDRRAEEYRKQSLEAKKKISILGEKRKNALKDQRSDEAFRIKCAMQDYQKEAKRADKKAAKLYFRARNRPGTSTIDVHSLKPEEALKAVEAALREIQLKGGHQLRVIVGQGLHSKNGRPVLKPSLTSAFRAQEMRVFESPNNPGMLIINMS